MSEDVIVGDNEVHSDLPFDVQAAVLKAAAPALTAGPAPRFGSWSWTQLAEDDPARWTAVWRAAMAWWFGHAFGPGVPIDVLEREAARLMIETSHAVSAGADWTRIGWRAFHESADVIAARKATPITPARCRQPGCRALVSVPHPLPDLMTIRCPRHAGLCEPAESDVDGGVAA